MFGVTLRSITKDVLEITVLLIRRQASADEPFYDVKYVMCVARIERMKVEARFWSNVG
jgi:hypothetical protein